MLFIFEVIEQNKEAPTFVYNDEMQSSIKSYGPSKAGRSFVKYGNSFGCMSYAVLIKGMPKSMNIQNSKGPTLRYHSSASANLSQKFQLKTSI